jgi:ATP-dependent DNA helicase RecG
MLVMTATPIPRTLSMTLYGDLALSVIDELPPGRTPIRTRVVADASRPRVYAEIRTQVNQGRQAYIVYPLVEESEKVDLAAAVDAAEHQRSAVFPDLRIGLLHGKLSSAEKESIMQRFKAHEIDLLIATTVVEVGVDVPNATIMVIEHAERFGLAQLHQLRGRIGRGEHPGSCFLLRSQKCSADGLKRLQVMEETCDGFRIAEADLQIRGPGDFIGVRQSGLPDLRVANLLRDGRLLELARQEAFALVADPAFQSEVKYASLRRTLQAKWAGRLELATIG